MRIPTMGKSLIDKGLFNEPGCRGWRQPSGRSFSVHKHEALLPEVHDPAENKGVKEFIACYGRRRRSLTKIAKGCGADLTVSKRVLEARALT